MPAGPSQKGSLWAAPPQTMTPFSSSRFSKPLFCEGAVSGAAGRRRLVAGGGAPTARCGGSGAHRRVRRPVARPASPPGRPKARPSKALAPFRRDLFWGPRSTAHGDGWRGGRRGWGAAGWRGGDVPPMRTGGHFWRFARTRRDAGLSAGSLRDVTARTASGSGTQIRGRGLGAAPPIGSGAKPASGSATQGIAWRRSDSPAIGRRTSSGKKGRGRIFGRGRRLRTFAARPESKPVRDP